MYYIVYKITNLINDKIYIGVHKTSSLDDGYMGSGKLIKLAIEKYGLENFKKEILFQYDSSEMMYEKESELVDEDFVSRSDTYNMKEGGNGGFDEFTQRKGSPAGVIAKKKLFECDSDWLVKYKKKLSEGQVLFYKNGGTNGFLGKSHSEETKRKIGEKNSVHQKGEGNSQYGKIWIYSLTEKKSIKIQKEELDYYLEQGWIKGRKIKF